MVDRRRMLQLIGVAGGSAVFGRALLAAEWVAGLSFTDAERQLMAKGIAELAQDFERLRAIRLDNGVPPALVFQTLAPRSDAAPPSTPSRMRAERPSARPADDDLVFAGAVELGRRIAARQISSVELTRLYLERLRGLGAELECVVTLTEPLALEQAARADRELAAGHARGPLHGVPWGAKDLLAVPGYPTTWGAGPFRNQVRPERAAVVERLEAAGAVLAAKLTLGELAWGGGSGARARAARRRARRRQPRRASAASRSARRPGAASSRRARAAA
jgi:hypothetical protein